MAPHSGAGGLAPRPMKPSEATARMASPMSMLAFTTSVETQLGRMWRASTQACPAPMVRAASTYGSCRNVSALASISRT